MDQRQTFNNPEELLSILSGLQHDKARVSLLVDMDGLTRIQGLITTIVNGDDPNHTSIHIDDEPAVLLKQIIGVNGSFRSDYSEC